MTTDAQGRAVIRVATLGLIAGLLAFAPVARAQAAGAASAPPTVRYASGPEAVVFEYSRQPAELGVEGHAILFRLYGDGLLALRDPRRSAPARSLTLRLSQQEIRNLLLAVVGKGLVEFDRGAVRSAIRSRAATAGAFVSYPDADVSSFEIRLDEYRPAGADHPGRTLTNVHKRIVWSHLQQEAVDHPGLQPLQALAELETELLAFLERSEATPPRPEEVE